MKEFSDRENGEHGKGELFLFNHSRNFKGLQPSMFYVCIRDQTGHYLSPKGDVG